MWGISRIILSVPRNIVVDLNNVIVMQPNWTRKTLGSQLIMPQTLSRQLQFIFRRACQAMLSGKIFKA